MIDEHDQDSVSAWENVLPPDLPDSGEPGTAAALDAPAADVAQPEPGSVAELRRRLEKLPHGHPSSPYHDDGERRPQPPRLRHLELAPPARQIPARTFVAREVQGAASQQPPPAPEPAATAAASAAGPAPRTAPDGSWSWGQVTLGRELVRIADDAYDRFRAAEGRDLFGGYGNGGLTPMVHRVAERVARGALAPEAARCALLEPDVFRARFADLLSRHPDRAPEQLARRVPGALSYSFVFAGERYAEGIAEVQEALELQGFQLQARRNTWSSAADRCVLTMWRDPLTDLPFQVQFHTAASHDAQRLARTTAELISDPRIPPAEAANLRSDIRTAWAALPVPPGSADIADYLRDSRSSARR